MLPPGLKLELLGPVECRRGLLLLTAASVRVLGGAVEEIGEQFAADRVLAERIAGGDPLVRDNLLAPRSVVAPALSLLPPPIPPAAGPSQTARPAIVNRSEHFGHKNPSAVQNAQPSSWGMNATRGRGKANAVNVQRPVAVISGGQRDRNATAPVGQQNFGGQGRSGGAGGSHPVPR